MHTPLALASHGIVLVRDIGPGGYYTQVGLEEFFTSPDPDIRTFSSDGMTWRLSGCPAHTHTTS